MPANPLKSIDEAESHRQGNSIEDSFGITFQSGTDSGVAMKRVNEATIRIVNRERLRSRDLKIFVSHNTAGTNKALVARKTRLTYQAPWSWLAVERAKFAR